MSASDSFPEESMSLQSESHSRAAFRSVSEEESIMSSEGFTPKQIMFQCMNTCKELVHAIFSKRILSHVCATLLQLIECAEKGERRLSLPGCHGSLFVANIDKYEVIVHLVLRLINELIVFPIYCSEKSFLVPDGSSQGENIRRVPLTVGFSSDDLPLWIADLMVAACFGGDNFPIQSRCISALLELIKLSSSLVDTAVAPSSFYNVSVVIVPALSKSQLQHLTDKTVFYEMLSRNLWDALASENSNVQNQACEQLCSLLDAVPQPEMCEDVIGWNLVQEDQAKRLAALRKFTVLWHLSRDRSASLQKRFFDRSLFVLLEGLTLWKESSVRSMVTKWLRHVLDRGDISRVVDPLVLTMLHPDTARVSAHYILEPERVPEVITPQSTCSTVEGSARFIYKGAPLEYSLAIVTSL